MGNEELHLALPKLYGAPAYARPTVVPVAPVDRPFDPDDLPLEAEQTVEEREYAAQVVGRPYSSEPGEPVSVASRNGSRSGSALLRGRPFRLGSITSRFRGDGVPSTGSSTNGSSADIGPATGSSSTGSALDDVPSNGGTPDGS